MTVPSHPEGKITYFTVVSIIVAFLLLNYFTSISLSLSITSVACTPPYNMLDEVNPVSPIAYAVEAIYLLRTLHQFFLVL